MPQLPNPKHDAFAYALAKGMSKVDAYVHAGYNDSPPSATRLSQKPEVVQRVQEIRAEMMGAAKALIEVPSEENAVALKDMGLTLDWCIEQYKDIADKAKDAGQFAPLTQLSKTFKASSKSKPPKTAAGMLMKTNHASNCPTRPRLLRHWRSYVIRVQTRDPK